MDDLPDTYLVSAAAAALLEELEWDAAELFARHLSGDWGEVSEEVRVMNTEPSARRRVSCYWCDRDEGVGLALIEEKGQIALLATTEFPQQPHWQKTDDVLGEH